MSANQSNLTAFDAETAPENACIRYEVCQNTVPGNGRICGPCLDQLRTADREGGKNRDRQ